MAQTNVEFDKIYSTEIVYAEDCWKLCGDAHCFSFSRCKSKFKLIAQTPFQELPLLPGEFEYLRDRNWLAQFGDYDHKVVEYQLDHRKIAAESIVSRRSQCACDHDTKPTICRLYPLLPVFAMVGRVTGIDKVGIYEELEKIEGLDPAWKVTHAPFPELEKFLAVANAIGRCPTSVYHLMAYQITKAHVASDLKVNIDGYKGDAFQLFEMRYLRRKLIDHGRLRTQLASLADDFQAQYGDQFRLSQ